MVLVSWEFWQNIIDSQRDTTIQLENFEAEVAMLYGQIWPRIQTTLITAETKLQVAHRDEMLEFQA